MSISAIQTFKNRRNYRTIDYWSVDSAGLRFAGPTSLAGLKYWMDARTLSGVGSGGAVTSIPDSSGIHSNNTGTGGTYQPTGLSSNPSLRFAGGGAYSMTVADLPNGNSAWTMMTVISRGTPDLMEAWGWGDNSGSGRRVAVFNQSGVYYTESIGAPNGGLWPASTPLVLTATYPGTTMSGVQHYVNGTAATMASSAPTAVLILQATANMTIGAIPGATGSNRFSGDIGQLVVYNSALNSVDRIALEKWFCALYGITWIG
jgi:hypothetical protein